MKLAQFWTGVSTLILPGRMAKNPSPSARKDFHHGLLGQMQMYVNFFDRNQRKEWEAPTVGIVLCSEKNDAMVRITLPEDNEQIHATRYQLYLPTEEQLRQELVIERERIEQTRRLAGIDESQLTSSES